MIKAIINGKMTDCVAANDHSFCPGPRENQTQSFEAFDIGGKHEGGRARHGHDIRGQPSRFIVPRQFGETDVNDVGRRVSGQGDHGNQAYHGNQDPNSEHDIASLSRQEKANPRLHQTGLIISHISGIWAYCRMIFKNRVNPFRVGFFLLHRP